MSLCAISHFNVMLQLKFASKYFSVKTHIKTNQLTEKAN